MPSATSVLSLPYPLGNEDVRDGNDAIKALADRLELLLANRSNRNVIRNGDFGIAQRGNGPFSTDGYTVDGVRKTSVGGTVSVSRTIPSPGTLNARYTLQVMTSGQSAVTDYTMLGLAVEGVDTLSGKQVTLSLTGNVVIGGAATKIGVSVRQVFGTGGSTAYETNVGYVTLAGPVGRYALIFTVPSIIGKTVGTANDDFLEIRLWFSAGSSLVNAGSIGIQANTFTISDVQLELGAFATPFERLPQQQQLSWCQRYYQRISPPSYSTVAIGFTWNPVACLIILPLPVSMRVLPAVGVSSVTHWGVYDSTATAKTITSIAIDPGSNSPPISVVRLNPGITGLTAGQTGTGFTSLLAGAGAWLELTAEL
jgi:hypothetical protein